jgi:5-methylcytosine-specific restriction endonuclease McrA
MNKVGNRTGSLTFKGRKHTKESKLKMSLAKKGKPKKYKLNLEGLKLGWGLLKGKHQKEEVKDKIRQSLLGRKASFATRKKMSKSHKNRKEKHWNWKGGVSRLHKLERQLVSYTFEYRFWRRSVFERDKYVCGMCGNNKGGKLEADHIKSWRNYPELRYSIDNGRTLCHECHKKTETYGNRKTTE